MKQHLIIWFAISVLLTIFLPNTAVAAVLVPIAVSMFKHLEVVNSFKDSEAKTIILLAIAWGTGLGGFGSPLGGAMNLISINYIENITGKEYMYIDWIVVMFPFLITLSAAILFYLLSFRLKEVTLPGSIYFFKKQYNNLPSISFGEKNSFILFVAAALFSFARPFYVSVLPGLKPPYIFIH